jgi:Tn3 transposase DDE domain-containing protein
MEAVLKQLRTEGMEVLSADVARLSPLVHQHINFQGRYSFALTESVAQGALRPLHDPDELDE